MEKPKCKLIGEDGNAFNLISKASNVLKKAGLQKEAAELIDRCFYKAEDYNQLLRIIMEYVDVE